MPKSKYTFAGEPSSYFRGQDLKVTRESDGRTILVNRKEQFWGLSVKSDYVLSQRSPEVQRAAHNLTLNALEHLEQAVTSFFWREVEHLAVQHGFSGKVWSEGRSGGWLCVDETEHFESSSPAEPTADDRDSVERWLAFCFDADDLRKTAEGVFDDRILEANQDLQVQLSRYADWVGAEVRSLDGQVFKVERLGIQYGKPALEQPGKVFATPDEATLVRKADGNIPARLTADPVMEQIFKIIEFRGDVTREQLDAWLDADDDHDPNELYVEHVAPAVNAIEDAIKAAQGAQA
jgi:hypothetical protein